MTESIKIISAEDLKKKLDAVEKFILLDVREEGSYKIEHIRRATSLPLTVIEGADQIFRKNKKIVVYCRSHDCLASDKAAKRLVEIGFTNITRYPGGIEEWKKLGYPTE